MARRRRKTKTTRTNGLAQRGSRCVRYKRVPSKSGGTVRRCAQFAGGGRKRRGLKGLVNRCVRYQELPDGRIRCARFEPVSDDVMPDSRARNRIYREAGEEPPPITEQGVIVKSGSRIIRRQRRAEARANRVAPRRVRLPAALPRNLRRRVRARAS